MASEGYVNEIQTSGQHDAVETTVRHVLRDILGLSDAQVAGFETRVIEYQTGGALSWD